MQILILGLSMLGVWLALGAVGAACSQYRLGGKVAWDLAILLTSAGPVGLFMGAVLCIAESEDPHSKTK